MLISAEAHDRGRVNIHRQAEAPESLTLNSRQQAKGLERRWSCVVQ